VRGADVLITDTTYRDHEYPSKCDWGHSCVSQVADLAARAEVKRLHLSPRPGQTDDDIDLKLAETRANSRAWARAWSASPCRGRRAGALED
jgi:ribonuclease BN (tRNA processing enzyme)